MLRSTESDNSLPEAIAVAILGLSADIKQDLSTDISDNPPIILVVAELR
jgi:hypothetical protein